MITYQYAKGLKIIIYMYIVQDYKGPTFRKDKPFFNLVKYKGHKMEGNQLLHGREATDLCLEDHNEDVIQFFL